MSACQDHRQCLLGVPSVNIDVQGDRYLSADDYLAYDLFSQGRPTGASNVLLLRKCTTIHQFCIHF